MATVVVKMLTRTPFTFDEAHCHRHFAGLDDLGCCLSRGGHSCLAYQKREAADDDVAV
jgi:hypothetical protein